MAVRAIETSASARPLGEGPLVVVGASGEGADRGADQREAFWVEDAFDASGAVGALVDGQAAGLESVFVAGGLGFCVGVAFPGVEQHLQIAVG